MTADASDAAARDPFADLPLLISVPKAAELLGISRASAYRLATSGDLPTKRLGRRLYIVTSRLKAFVEKEADAA